MQAFTSNTAQGCEVTGASKKMTSYRTWLFSGGWPRFEGWPAKNVHTDLASAQKGGLPTRAASGAMMQGYLCELMIGVFGESWVNGGRLTLKFIRIVDVGDEIVSKCRVSSKESDGTSTRFDLDVWCENQHGAQVVIGTGTGWVVDSQP